jgi:flagellar biosynthesis protein FlhB
MSETSTPEERTEAPSDKRMGKLRKEGQIHSSNEVVQVASLITGFLMLQALWSTFYLGLQGVFRKSFQMIGNHEPITIDVMHIGFIGLLRSMVPMLMILVIVIAVIASLAQMLQTKWNIKEKKIHFQFHMLNPISGIKRIISISGVVNVLKALAKLALIIPIAYYALKGYSPYMISLVHLDIDEIFSFTGEAMNSLFWKIMYVLIAMAIFDYVYGKFRWLKQNKMTKDEVKDERKAVEGDEATKRRIQQKGLARIMQRIAQSVPKAHVVVTNPTHYSVALQYDRGKDRAPRVVAKGKGFMALRIREIARASGVPVLERKPLARALFKSVEVGAEIPRDLFKAVAEVLAYVHRIKNPWSAQRAPQQK